MNPYAPPRADDAPPRLPTAAGGAVPWRDGNALVIPRVGAMLPPRCVVCNEPGAGSIPWRLVWFSPWLYPLIALAGIGFVIAVLMTRREARVLVHVCKSHQRRFAAGLLLVAAALTLTALATFLERRWLLAPVPVLGVMAFLLTRLVRAQRMDQSYAWLKVGQPFLESFPPRADAHVTPRV